MPSLLCTPIVELRKMLNIGISFWHHYNEYYIYWRNIYMYVRVYHHVAPKYLSLYLPSVKREIEKIADRWPCSVYFWILHICCTKLYIYIIINIFSIIVLLGKHVVILLYDITVPLHIYLYIYYYISNIIIYSAEKNITLLYDLLEWTFFSNKQSPLLFLMYGRTPHSSSDGIDVVSTTSSGHCVSPLRYIRTIAENGSTCTYKLGEFF